jgi:isovaleryl-CoA dehydrogenase
MIYFTPEQQAFQQTIRDFFEHEVNPHIDEWEKARTFPAHQVFKRCGELGMLGITFDPAYGGSGLDYWWTAAYCEAMSEACPCNGIPMAIMVQTDMCTPALHDFGSPELKERFLRPSIAGEMVGAIGVSEPGAGSDVFSIRTTARRDGDFYVVNGRKIFITNGTQADYITLLTKTDATQAHHGFTLLVVPTDTPGFAVAKKLEKIGNHSSDTAELVFEDCLVPVDNLIGREGESAKHMMRNLEIERLTLAAMSLGIALRCLEVMVNYANERKAFGVPLRDFGQVQRHVAESYAEFKAARCFVYDVARRLDLNSSGNRVDADAAKLFASRIAKEIADRAIQVLGGYGYMGEYVVERLWRDAKLLEIGGGTLEAHQKNITKDLSRAPELIRR